MRNMTLIGHRNTSSLLWLSLLLTLFIERILQGMYANSTITSRHLDAAGSRSTNFNGITFKSHRNSLELCKHQTIDTVKIDQG